MLLLWSKDIVLCTDGPAELPPEERHRLTAHRIVIREECIAHLKGTEDGELERIVFVGGDALARRALFFNTGQYQRSPLLEKLNCELTDKGSACTGEFEETRISGLYVAGDASRDLQLAIVAAAEGTRAAFAVNKALLQEAGLE